MMLTEPIESINQQLIDLFGIDTISGKAIWRVVWSEDQLEKQYGTFNDFTTNGLFIRTVTETRIIPKYRQWIQQRYVLERLTVIPDINRDTLPESNVSYEPILVFETLKGEYKPPQVVECKFTIDCVYAAMGKSSLAKYKDPEGTPEEALEAKKERINELTEAIFGDETDVSDALSRHEGIVVPSNYKGDN